MIGESQKTLLLDEPELHLHPDIQKRILNLLSESVNYGRNQILMITHSPYLVSAENVKTTWRFTKTKYGTKVHNLGRVLAELNDQERSKLVVKLSSPELRSVLFSRGVILVEGPSDKIVVEEVDRFLSTKHKGADIDESEWPIINIGGKKSLPSFMNLTRMLGVPNVSVLDYDALMHRECVIKSDGREIKTSSIISALWCTNERENLLNNMALSSEVPDSEWYEQSLLDSLRTLALEHCIFVFSTDLEGVMQTGKTGNKPLKALERILKLIEQDKVPLEFYEMCKFLREHIITVTLT